MSLTPPALDPKPQFTTLYWDKVPREKVKAKVKRITAIDDEYTEFVFDNGNAFQRRTETLDPDVMNRSKLHANSIVYVELINDELVTGMWVPEVGWAFRMTSEDLADYARKLAGAMHARRQAAEEELVEFMAEAILEGLAEQGVIFEDGRLEGAAFSPRGLAGHVMRAMSEAKSSSAR